MNATKHESFRTMRDCGVNGSQVIGMIMRNRTYMIYYFIIKKKVDCKAIVRLHSEYYT